MAPIKKGPHVKPVRKLTRDGKIKDYFRVVPKEPPVSVKPPISTKLSVLAKPFVPAKPAVHAKSPVPAKPAVPVKPTHARIHEYKDQSDICAGTKRVSRPEREELHYLGFGNTDFERKGRAILVEYLKVAQRAQQDTNSTYFNSESDDLLLHYEKEMVKLAEHGTYTKQARCWDNPGWTTTREEKRNAEVERRLEFEREQKAILVKYQEKMVRLVKSRDAVKATLNRADVRATLDREIHYQMEVMQCFQNLKEKLGSGHGNNGNATGEDSPPPVYIRGEYTLYSEHFLRSFIELKPQWFKDDFLRSWCTGTIRVGQRWGDGRRPGAEVSLTRGDADRITFIYGAPGCPSTQSCQARWHYANVTAEARITFLGGAYLILNLMDTGFGERIQFYGVLERDEEEMAEWWPRMPEWKPHSYYVAPYNPVLPRGWT